MQKGQTILWVVVGVLVIATIAGGAYYLGKSQTFKLQQKNSTNNQQACTQDAKLCPDGSYVSRVGPKCEFAACPTPKIQESSPTPSPS